MLRKHLLTAAASAFILSSSAAFLTPGEALQRVGDNRNGRHISTSSSPELKLTVKSQKGIPAVYLFNKDGEGSLILSASDKALPILGYTENGTLDPDNLPPQLLAWLHEYANQIAWAEEEPGMQETREATFEYPLDWTYIAPLLKTKWDQGAPYNGELANYVYATGCVATAMAQIMKYHEWPERGHGSNTYTDAFGNTYSMDFGSEPFLWNEMLDSYKGTYTPQEADAVAYLMKACGYSTDMNYSGSSGTQVERAGVALITYFDYDGSLEVIKRHQYTHTEWATILYNQLKNVGPVLYSGESLGGFAHAFVADGYDGNGYFHINWGWSGLADGYYSLDALVPSSQGTGGSYSPTYNYGGYNFTQGMIVNIKKEQTAMPFAPVGELTLLGNVSGEIDGDVLTMTMTEANPGNLCNNSLVTVSPVFGVCVENTSTGDITYIETEEYYFGGEEATDLSFGPGSLMQPQFSLVIDLDSSLPANIYRVTLVWRPKDGEDTNWQNFIIANGCHDYLFISKEEGGEYEVENIPMDRFSIDSARLLSPLYMRNPVEIEFTLTNPSDTELTQSIIPVLLYGDDRKLSFEGDSRLFTVGPHETVTVSAVYSLSSVQGGTSPTESRPREYVLGAYDYGRLLGLYFNTGYFSEAYYGDLATVSMARPGNNASLKLVNVGIDNASEEYSDGSNPVYGIDDFSDIELSVEVEGVNAFLAVPMSAVITEYGAGAEGVLNPVYEKNFEELVYVTPGETVTASTVLKMNDFDPGKIYVAEIYYVQQNNRLSLGGVCFGASSGIENVGMTGESVTEVYDLSGSQVFTDFETLGKGIYIIKTKDNNGKTRTIKKIKI